MTILTYLELRVTACRAEVWLNDIPMGRCQPGLGAGQAWLAHSYLVDGPNKLEILIEPGTTPATCRTPEQALRSLPGAAAQARLVRYPEGAITGSDEGEVVLSTSWTDLPEPVQFPHSSVEEKDLGPIAGHRWAWQDCPPLDPLDGDRAALVDAIQGIHEAFTAGEGASIVQLAAPYFSDQVLATPAWARSDLEADLRRDVAANVGREDWVKPFTPDDCSLRLCADGRLVECLDHTWQPLIGTKPQPDGDEYPLPLFLGKHDGAVKIIR